MSTEHDQREHTDKINERIELLMREGMSSNDAVDQAVEEAFPWVSYEGDEEVLLILDAKS